MKINITKSYNFFVDTWYINYGLGKSILTISTCPHRKERQYRFYYDSNGDEFKIIYADNEYSAIEQAIKILKKKIYLEVVKRVEVINSDWVISETNSAKFYGKEFDNRRV